MGKQLAINNSEQIKEVQLAPKITQVLNLPIGSIPFAIKNIRGKILLFIICDITEKVTEQVRIDINSHNQPITFPSSSYYLGTFEITRQDGAYFILHAFMSKKSHRITVPSNVVSIFDLIKKIKA